MVRTTTHCPRPRAIHRGAIIVSSLRVIRRARFLGRRKVAGDVELAEDVKEVFHVVAPANVGRQRGELAALQWGDIDFNSKLVIVRRNISLGKVKKTKTENVRRVDLSDALLAELQAMKRRRQAHYLSQGMNEIPEWVFLSHEGCRIDMDNVKTRRFHKALTKAGLRRIRFHYLRRTFASLFIQNGKSLAYVKDQLGHKSIKMTVDVYGHLVPGANRAAVNRLPALVHGPIG